VGATNDERGASGQDEFLERVGNVHSGDAEFSGCERLGIVLSAHVANDHDVRSGAS
jgi:hypothetical protein